MQFGLKQNSKGAKSLRCPVPGWGGGGLGTSEQGRTDPIQHSEVRDRLDMFKGIGMSMNDPFENFRKSKSHGFTTRMREKAEATAVVPSSKPDN